MIDVLRRCFPKRFDSWRPTLTELVPSLGTRLSDQPALFQQLWSWGSGVLQLTGP